VTHCRIRLRSAPNSRAAGEDAKETPIIIVANQSQVPVDKGEPAGVTDWLTRPYSLQYARSRMRAWLMRSMLRWRKAALPPDEEERLAAVYRLGLLDTDAEERFDRHARIAAAAFGAPIALVTLIDRERQWYKGPLRLRFQRDVARHGLSALTLFSKANRWS
jgi:hypothetical protein